MAKSRGRKRVKPKDNARRAKKKVSPLTSDKVEYVDYKDTELLKRFMSDRAKIRARRVSGNDVQQQRVVARAVKNAREMGLLPYTSRVTTQRRNRSERGERGDRGDRRGPRPDRQDDRSEAPTSEAPAEAAAETTETAEVEA